MEHLNQPTPFFCRGFFLNFLFLGFFSNFFFVFYFFRFITIQLDVKNLVCLCSMNFTYCTTLVELTIKKKNHNQNQTSPFFQTITFLDNVERKSELNFELNF
jgi:hypothetical protein